MLLQLPARRPLVLGRPVAYPVPAALIDYDLTADTLDPSLTFVRSTVKNIFDSSGVLTQQAIDALGVDYHPQTLARRGRLLEPARTNYVQNNTMVGAVAGAARNTGTISSVSRSGSTTVVIVAAGHDVTVGDMITVSNATPSDYNGVYKISASTAGVSYSYVVATSATDSASGYTISVVSRGTNPSRWSFSSVANGITTTIVGTGTQNGISYFDVRVAGLASGVNTIIRTETLTTIPATQGQTWTASSFVAIVGGSTNGITDFSHRFGAYSSAPLYLGDIASSGSMSLPTSLSGSARNILVGTASNASTSYVNQQMFIQHPSGAVFDITLRIGMPQMEQGNGASSVIATNNTGAVTRSGDSLRRLSLPAGFDQTRGTVAMEWELQEPGAAGGIISELGGTGTERIFFGMYSGGANDCQVVAAGVTQAGSTSTSQQQNSGVIYRTVRAYQANDAARADSNGSLLYGAPQTIPAVSALGLGVSLVSGAAQPNAWLRRWRYWPQRLTNNQLAQIAAGLA